MIERFEIEDLIVQDEFGVVFRALDTETRLHVALRRFFPFGADGGGLNADEQVAYGIALGRLAEVKHPALRSVIGGGCDPVDGMPFIATEWVEGNTLQVLTDSRFLTEAETSTMLYQAIEICELLSEVLTEEAIWVETGLSTVIIGAHESHRAFTFWISPLKWLGKIEGERGLGSLVRLTEKAMGWTEGNFPKQATGGLADWLSWLRANAESSTLAEARERLTASFTVASPAPTRAVPRVVHRAKPVVYKKSSGNLLWYIVGGSMAATAIGGWIALQNFPSIFGKMPEDPSRVNSGQAAPLVMEVEQPEIPIISKTAQAEESETPAEGPLTVSGETPEERADRIAAEFTAVARDSNSTSVSGSSAARISGDKGPPTVFKPSDQQALVAHENRPAIIEGNLAEIGHSKSKKTLYLLFTKNAGTSEARGAVVVNGAPPSLTEASLASLVGKTIRIEGNVKVERVGTMVRPVISIENRAAITPPE